MVYYDHPGECSPEKDCLGWFWVAFRQPEWKSSSESRHREVLITCKGSLGCTYPTPCPDHVHLQITRKKQLCTLTLLVLSTAHVRCYARTRTQSCSQLMLDVVVFLETFLPYQVLSVFGFVSVLNSFMFKEGSYCKLQCKCLKKHTFLLF